MACNATDIPRLSFPRNEIIEITPASYNNEATRILIPGLPEETIAGSPEDLKIPVAPSQPPSGRITPMSLTSLESGTGTLRTAISLPKNGTLTPQDPGTGSLLLVERALRN